LAYSTALSKPLKVVVERSLCSNSYQRHNI
jgi:hypothetical protein